MIDNYTVKARVYPMIILFIPIVIIGIFYSIEFERIVLLLSSIGIAGALMYLFAQIGRDQGKRKEPLLWKSWGGAPTTQLIRLTDNRIDSHTKQRYHQKLQSLCPLSPIPSMQMEQGNIGKADEVYKAWTKFLISKTRDPKAYSLLFKDNISYGFRRNLWGLKPYGILLTVLLMISNYIFWFMHTGSYNPLIYPNNFLYSELALFCILLFWVVTVTRSWIKIPAFSYAERLLESVEGM